MSNSIDTESARATIIRYCCITGFITCLLVSAVTASKVYLLNLSFLTLVVPVGTSLYAITFLCTDIISETAGRKHAFILVLSGFFARIFALLFFIFAVNIKGAEGLWHNQAEYALILLGIGKDGAGRILLAGIVAYPISQCVDILLFHTFRERHKGRNLLWFRNVVSTFISQSVDSTCFILFAFAGRDGFNARVLFTIILGQITVKWLIAMMDTPFVYMARNFVEGRSLFDLRG